MTRDAGVVRTGASLARAADEVAALASASADPGSGAMAAETANLLTVATALIAAAGARCESRGAHTRDDHPASDPAQRHRLVVG